MKDPAKYFADSYAKARSLFSEAATAENAALGSMAHPLQGPDGEALATDLAWVGPRDAERLLITISATHGVEGYCGSGVQAGSLSAGRYRDLPEGLAVLMIHAINPHGFAWTRRVTEDNVDLNRNFADFEAPLPINPGYEDLHEVICPPSWDPETIERTFANLMGYAETHSMAALQQAVSGGQYAHADGVFYGGRGPTWSHRTLDALLRQHGARARKVAVIDYHTGLGPFGYGERICPHPADSAGRQRAEDWFGRDVTSTDDGSSSSAPLVGTNQKRDRNGRWLTPKSRRSHWSTAPNRCSKCSTPCAATTGCTRTATLSDRQRSRSRRRSVAVFIPARRSGAARSGIVRWKRKTWRYAPWPGADARYDDGGDLLSRKLCRSPRALPRGLRRCGDRGRTATEPECRPGRRSALQRRCLDRTEGRGLRPGPSLRNAWHRGLLRFPAYSWVCFSRA